MERAHQSQFKSQLLELVLTQEMNLVESVGGVEDIPIVLLRAGREA